MATSFYLRRRQQLRYYLPLTIWYTSIMHSQLGNGAQKVCFIEFLYLLPYLTFGLSGGTKSHGQQVLITFNTLLLPISMSALARMEIPLFSYSSVYAHLLADFWPQCIGKEFAYMPHRRYSTHMNDIWTLSVILIMMVYRCFDGSCIRKQKRTGQGERAG